MQIFLTIIAGTCTFVFGKIFLKLYVEPIKKYNHVISEITDELILYANVYTNPKTLEDPKQAEACKEFRIFSSKLQASIHLVPSYYLMAKALSLPSIEGVTKVSENLIRLHNGHNHALANQGILNYYSVQKIRQALNIYIPSNELLNPALERSLSRPS